MTDARRRTHQQAELRRLGTRLGSLGASLDRTYRVLALILPDGYPSGGGLEPVSGGDRSDPTLAAVEARRALTDEYQSRTGEAVRTGLATVDTTIKVIDRSIQEALDDLTRILAVEAPEVAAPAPGSGYCRACRRWVPGTPEDRLRSGLDARHYHQWIRAGRPDMLGFIRAVQLEIGLIEPGGRTVAPELDTTEVTA